MNEFIVPKPINEIPVVPIADIQTGNLLAYTGTGDLKQISANALLSQITSGIFGKATQSNAPNPDPAYKRYNVVEPITTGSAWGIEVTQLELDANRVFFDVENGVVSKFSEPILRGADGENKIDKYVPGNTYQSGQQVITDDGWFGVRDGMSALPTDIPSEDSLVWEVISAGAGKEVESVLKYFLENNTFVEQDETNFGAVEGNYKPLYIDNTERDITSIYVEGFCFPPQFIIGIKEDNSTVSLVDQDGVYRIEKSFELDFSEYKQILVRFHAPHTNIVSKTTRAVKTPPIEDVVLKEINKIGDIVGAFKNGSDILTVGNLAKNTGYKRPDLSISDSDRGFWSEIPYKKGFNKLNYSAKFTTDPSNGAWAIMAVLKDGTTSKIKFGTLGEVINGIFTIPENTVQIFVNFGAPQFISDPFPKNVYLFKEGVSENAILNYLTNVYKVETPLNRSFVRLHRPKSLFRMDLDGILPTDESPTRNKVPMVLSLYDEKNEKYFKVDVDVKIQGNATAGMPKKNYSIKFKNDLGGKLKIKMGNWLPFSGFHLKGYNTDSSYTRTISAGKLLKQIFDNRDFPQNMQGTFMASHADPFNFNNYLNEAKLHVDGIPTKVFLNEAFFEIAVMQQKRDADIFHINEYDINQIFITNNNGFEPMDMYNGFKENMWEVRSPKMDGYEENLPVPDATVQAKLDRFFNWFKGVQNGTIDFNTTKADYINEKNWIDIYVHSNVINNYDFFGNNLNFAILNGLTSIFVTDMDATVGVFGSSTTGFAGQLAGYNQLLPQIKARYAELRNNKIISLNNLYNIYNEIPAMIGGEDYIQNYKKWGGIVDSPGIHSMPYIMEWFRQRLVWLDNQWNYVP